jgi:hypothetical protein
MGQYLKLGKIIYIIYVHFNLNFVTILSFGFVLREIFYNSKSKNVNIV